MWTENSGRTWKSRAALPVLAACVLVSAVPVNIKAAGTITAIRVNGSYKPTMVWDWCQLHDPSAPLDGGKSRNTFDNPIHFFRDRGGSIYTIAANNLNYRVPLNSSFNALRALDSTDVLFDAHVQLQGPGSTYYHTVTETDLSSGSCVEPDYDNRMWLFGLSTSDGVSYSALAHHEYYPRTCPSGGDTNDWINAIHHLTSYTPTGGTLAFRPHAYVSYYQNGGVSNSDRLVVIPRPYSASSMPTKCFAQGAFHPSNVVQEGGFYYAIVSVAFLPATIPSLSIGSCEHPAQYPGGAIPHTGGFMMIRTTHPDTPSAWQVRTDDGWSNRNVHTWQGPGGQDVTVFLPQANWNPYRDQVTGGQNLTYSLVRHLATGKWIGFGYSNQGTLTLSYAVSTSLESPSWSPVTNVQGIPPYPAPQLGPGNYPSLQSHIDGSYVFQYVDDYPFLYYVCDMKPNNGLCPGVEGADPHDRDIWRAPLHIESSGVASSVVHDASSEFSGTQGQSGWSYRASGSGLMVNDGTTRWKPLGASFPLVWSAGGHPGESEDAVRRWTTPGPGSVHITGRAAKSDTTGGDGVTVSIKKGPDLFIWQRDITFNNSVGYTFDLWLVVEPGEFIDFIINRGPSTVSYDSTDFHPTIEFTPY